MSQRNDTASQRLLGTWSLVSVVREDVPSGATTDMLGPSPRGFITYGADGRMMVMIVRAGRVRPAGDTPSPTEAEALFRSMTSYAGTYVATDTEVTHAVEISWNEIWSGTKQTRFHQFDGDRLTLSTPVSPDPYDGKMSVRRMTWEKVR